MKENDIVTIKDGSWGRLIDEQRITEPSLAYAGYAGLKYKVLMTGCKFPLLQNGISSQPIQHQSNTLLIGLEGLTRDKIVIIRDDQCKVYNTHTITINGKNIEISEESYQSLKKSLV